MIKKIKTLVKDNKEILKNRKTFLIDSFIGPMVKGIFDTIGALTLTSSQHLSDLAH